MSTGVLLMAYGTPATPDDIEAYYTHIRRGRPPTPELLADLRRRYDAIGGTSPLLSITRAQARALQAALGDGFRVELGMRHAPPFIEEGVRRLADAGVAHGVGIVLAPHFSELSVGQYVTRARAAAHADGPPMTFVEDWHLAPGYVALLASRVRQALARMPVARAQVEVIFTAHSLPARVDTTGDPYTTQVRATAEAVAERADVPRWSVAWQSAGRTEEEWLGPDLLLALARAAAGGARAAVVCPAGFVADHLEVLYDVDIEARRAAEACGLAFARTASPNDDPAFVSTLAGVVKQHVRARA